jgi:hypothetical protein
MAVLDKTMSKWFSKFRVFMRASIQLFFHINIRERGVLATGFYPAHPPCPLSSLRMRKTPDGICILGLLSIMAGAWQQSILSLHYNLFSVSNWLGSIGWVELCYQKHVDCYLLYNCVYWFILFLAGFFSSLLFLATSCSGVQLWRVHICCIRPKTDCQAGGGSHLSCLFSPVPGEWLLSSPC